MTKIAIVTGGNSGIGKAIVKQFIEEGFKVFIIGRDEGKLRNTEKEFGENVVGYQVDISKPKEIEEFVNDIVRQHNTIDVLVNNAGFVKDTELTLSLEELEANWDSMVNTMLKGSFLMTAATVPYFKKNYKHKFYRGIYRRKKSWGFRLCSCKSWNSWLDVRVCKRIKPSRNNG